VNVSSGCAWKRCRDASSKEKWLSLNVGTHFETLYLPKYVVMQKRFFDRYLKDLDNG